LGYLIDGETRAAESALVLAGFAVKRFDVEVPL
jgi:hypothetical protein